MFRRHSAIMLLIDPATGAIVDANNAAELFYGYSHQVLTELNICDINTMETEQLARSYGNALHEAQNCLTFTHRLASGETRTVEVHSTPITVEQSPLLFFIIHDISERRRQEDHIRDIEAQYRYLYEAVHDAIILVDSASLTILNVNGAAGPLFGYTRDELLVMTYLQLTAFPKNSIQLFKQRIGHTEHLIHKKQDGTLFPADITCGFYTLKDRELAVIVLRDTSDTLRTIQALKSSETRFSTAFMSSPIPIAITNHETGQFIDVNHSLLKYYGYERDEFIGRTSLELNMWENPLDRERMFELLRLHGFVRDYETSSLDSHGNKGYVLISIEKIELDGTTCLLVMLNDITERKKTDQELRAIHDELENLVVERTISLQKMNKRLLDELEEGRRKQKALLESQHRLETVSFELSLSEERERSRIAGELHDQVSQNLIVAKMRLAGLMAQSENRSRDEIDRIDQVLDQVLKDIRSLTFQLRPPVLANAGLESALEWLCEQFSRDFSIQFSTQDDGQPKVLIYEVRSIVFQAVRELMMNVVKHAQATRTNIALERVENRLYITVCDNGIGIGPAFKEGFGLFNTRQKIEGLGGYFGIASLPETGTGVTLSVPLQTSQDERITAP